MSEAATARMLISRARNRYKDIDADKTSGGKFYTTHAHWLTRPVIEFIESALKMAPGFLDPFAGEGHLLTVCADRFQRPVAGFDLHAEQWTSQDSLRHIPSTPSILVTNPPYLAKHSASRKGVGASVAAYYAESGLDDLYQVALLRCLAAARFTVAIIPETFLNSSFPKEALTAVSVLERNPFEDTENPVCVACFDAHTTTGETAARLFVEDQFCLSAGELGALRRTVSRDSRIRFNDPLGTIALRAVDSTDPKAPAGFLLGEGFVYDRQNIKISSRLLTYLSVPGLPTERRPALIAAANQRLAELRSASHDLALSPFKGNNREGRRRRRLDYGLARRLLVEALEEIG